MFSSSHDGAITYTDMQTFLNVKLSMPADKVDKLFAEISGKNAAIKTKGKQSQGDVLLVLTPAINRISFFKQMSSRRSLRNIRSYQPCFCCNHEAISV